MESATPFETRTTMRWQVTGHGDGWADEGGVGQFCSPSDMGMCREPVLEHFRRTLQEESKNEASTSIPSHEEGEGEATIVRREMSDARPFSLGGLVEIGQSGS